MSTMTHIAGFLVDDDGTVYEIHYGTPAWHATREWARFHGIDTHRVPAGSVIVRDAADCRLLYFEYETEDDGRIKVDHGEPVAAARIEQGEAPPLPFPREVTG